MPLPFKELAGDTVSVPAQDSGTALYHPAAPAPRVKDTMQPNALRFVPFVLNLSKGRRAHTWASTRSARTEIA